MYSIVKNIEIFEQGLNDNPNPIILIDLNTYDILYWNDSYKIFLETHFNLKAEDFHNVNEMNPEIKEMFHFLIERLKDKKIFLKETELNKRNIKIQIIRSLSYFVVFIDVTETKELLLAYKEKSEKLENARKNNIQLMKKNIKLWSIITSRLLQFTFVTAVFLGILTSLIKDYYLNKYQERERKFEEFMTEQNKIKIQMLESITIISENNKKALEILLKREEEVNKTLKQIKRMIKETKD